MDFNSIHHLIYGFLSGITEILPISSRAHHVLMAKLLGADASIGFPVLLIHMGIFTALYVYSRSQLIKMSRARKLARIPKKKRKRPLDLGSLMDFRFLMTMLIPILLMLLFFRKLATFDYSLLMVAGFLFLNGIVLYIPQFLPSSNRDARSLSRVDGLLMGLGGTLSVFPGLSSVGASVSVGSVCGVERTYALKMTLIAEMAYTAGLMVYDILDIAERGFGILSLPLFTAYTLAALAAFASTMLGIRIMRTLASESGYHIFSYYCWGVAIFAFILNLMA